MTYLLAESCTRLLAVSRQLPPIPVVAAACSVCTKTVFTGFGPREGKGAQRQQLYFASSGSRKLIYERQGLRRFGSCTDTPTISDADKTGPPAGEQKRQLSPAAVERLLKISRPGSSRQKAKNTHGQIEQASSGVCTAPLEGNKTCEETKAPLEEQKKSNDEWKEGVNGSGEFGFKYKGPEPTLHGDWAHKGRVSDF